MDPMKRLALTITAGFAMPLFLSLEATACEDCVAFCAGGLSAGPGRDAEVDEGEANRWGSIQGTIVTWSFVNGNGIDVEESDAPMHIAPIIGGQDDFPANARDLFRQAFDDWQRVADITFVELTDGSDGDMRVGAHQFVGTTLGHGFFPGQHPLAGDVHMRINDGGWTAESLRVVGMHEIGHGIGLHHILSGSSGEIMHSTHSGNEINATTQDITYLQSIYGPPLPTIESIEIADDSGRSLLFRVNWSYPTEPLIPATFTRFHDGQVDVDEVIRTAQVTVAADDLRELLSFDLRHMPLQFETITDGGEDNETAFDVVTPGLGGSLSWERTGFRVNTGSKAYRVDLDAAEFSGDFQLPLLVPVQASGTTVFRFQRAFFFTAAQKIRYFVAVDGDEPILLQEETGSSNSNQADSPFTLREYDLSAHAGRNILVSFEYLNASAFENDDNGVSIDDIELTDVFTATGTPVVLSNTIAAATRQFDADTGPGIHDIEMRALYDQSNAGAYTLPIRRTLVAVPVVTNVDSPTADATYASGAEILIEVTFDTTVLTVTGTPTLDLDVSGVIGETVYVSGAPGTVLTFRYVVQSGDNSADLQYVDVDALSLSGGTILDINANPVNRTLPALNSGQSLAGNRAIVVDTAGATVVTVLAFSSDGLFGIGGTVEIDVILSELSQVTGSPTLLLETGTTDRLATFQSVNGNAMRFSYEVQAGDESADLGYAGTDSLNLNGGAITDAQGNPAALDLPPREGAGALDFNSALVIDGIAPELDVLLANNANDDYGAGAVLEFVARFGEPVNVTGVPTLGLDPGLANFADGSGTTDLIFRYTVQPGDNATGIQVGNPALGGGTITDPAGNPADLSVAPLDVPGIVIDTTPPVVTGVSSPDALVTTNQTIQIDVQFDDPVTVTGEPTLQLATNDAADSATFGGGSGTLTLTFNLDIVAGQNTELLDYSDTDALQLNGGTIRDAAGNAADLTLPVPGTAGSLASSNTIVIDTIPPTFVGGFVSGDNGSVLAQFSEGMFGDETASTPVQPGGFSIVLNGRRAATVVQIVGVEQPDGSAAVGGETAVRLLLNITGAPEAADTLTITGDTVGDRAGQAMGPGNLEVRLHGPLQFDVTLDSTGIAPVTVTLGRDPAALDGFDGFDTVTGNDAIVLREQGGAAQTLNRDTRSLQVLSRWRLEVAEGITDATLSWGSPGGNPEFLLYLQPLTGETPSGPPVDMTVSSQFLIGNYTHFEVAYGPPDVIPGLILQAGWNLVSLPAMVLADIATLLPATVRIGAVWCWNGESYVAVPEDEPLNAELGYWIFSPGGTTADVEGIVADAVLSLSAPWALIGPTTDQTAPPGILWGWNAVTQRLFLADALQRTGGYWYYSAAPRVVDLNE